MQASAFGFGELLSSLLQRYARPIFRNLLSDALESLLQGLPASGQAFGLAPAPPAPPDASVSPRCVTKSDLQVHLCKCILCA